MSNVDVDSVRVDGTTACIVTIWPKSCEKIHVEAALDNVGPASMMASWIDESRLGRCCGIDNDDENDECSLWSTILAAPLPVVGGIPSTRVTSVVAAVVAATSTVASLPLRAFPNIRMRTISRNFKDFDVVIDIREIISLCAYMLRQYIIRVTNQEGKEEVVTGGVDPNVAKGRDTVYYRYMGSFTTPPCTEGAIWTVVRKVHTVSLSQLALLKEPVLAGYENNARPLQDVNNREIDLFVPLPLINT
uniref:Alpha-carbonic anhydrase domain-containing protein n=1 Tax=Oryza brachyantha TaxID=4533 RepID=J3MT24_ORYBR